MNDEGGMCHAHREDRQVCGKGDGQTGRWEKGWEASGEEARKCRCLGRVKS